jgi:hypothetical protein
VHFAKNLITQLRVKMFVMSTKENKFLSEMVAVLSACVRDTYQNNVTKDVESVKGFTINQYAKVEIIQRNFRRNKRFPRALSKQTQSDQQWRHQQ